MNVLILFTVALTAGILPMLAYALIVWWLDRWEKEPLPLLLAAFLWGFVPSAVFALITQLIIGAPIYAFIRGDLFLADLFMASVIAPITEELVKGAAVMLIFIFWHDEIDSLLDGIVYGSLIGFGFAAIENILYFSATPDALACLIPMRAFIFGLNHAFFTSFIGLGFALARQSNHLGLRLLYPTLGFAAAMLAHGLHNFTVSFGLLGLPIALLADWSGALIILIIMLVSLTYEARWIRTYLTDEVAAGILTARQFKAATSFIERGYFASLFPNPARFFINRRFYHLCTELAFKKRQRDRHGPTPRLEARIATLRDQIAALSPSL